MLTRWKLRGWFGMAGLVLFGIWNAVVSLSTVSIHSGGTLIGLAAFLCLVLFDMGARGLPVYRRRLAYDPMLHSIIKVWVVGGYVLASAVSLLLISNQMWVGYALMLAAGAGGYYLAWREPMRPDRLHLMLVGNVLIGAGGMAWLMAWINAIA